MTHLLIGIGLQHPWIEVRRANIDLPGYAPGSDGVGSGGSGLRAELDLDARLHPLPPTSFRSLLEAEALMWPRGHQHA